MRKKLFWEMLLKFLLLFVISIITLLIFLSITLENFYYNQIEKELEETLGMLEKIFSGRTGNRDFQALCRELAGGADTRLTVVLADGKVIGDSEEDPLVMNNHATRPEIYRALIGETGSAIRYSDTLGINMLYLAVPLYDTDSGELFGVLRAARGVKEIDSKLDDLYLRIITAGIIALIIMVFIISLVARGINEPVLRLKQAANEYSAGNFDVKTRIKRPVELMTLSESMNMMATKIKKNVTTITIHKNKLEAILSHMVEPLIVLDTDLLIKEINPAAASLFDLDSRKVIGSSLIDVIRNVKLFDFAKKAVKRDKFGEIAIVVKNDPGLHLQVHGTPLFTKDKVKAGLLLVMNDITRLIKLENMRKDFVANVSHELKTPITSIKGFVEILNDGAYKDGEKAPEFLEIIQQQTDRLNSIIDDLLALSQLEQDEDAGIDRDRYLMHEIINNAVKNCHLKARLKDVDIRTEVDSELWAKVNSFLIEQAVTNLLDNAVKYSPDRGLVNISCIEDELEQNMLVISVKDSGCGIPKKYQSRVFQRFYRVDKARSRELGGTGLGLAIVKHIAFAHGGRVSVESEIGEGSTFYLRLPVR